MPQKAASGSILCDFTADRRIAAKVASRVTRRLSNSINENRFWERMMNHPFAAAFVFAIASIAPVLPANAGACGEDVAAFRQTLPLNQKDAAVVGTAPQSVGAQLGHQPTPETIARAEQSARAEITTILAQAESYDAAGKQRECRDALAKAKLLANP
jgi:hypothetical protein